MIKMRRLEEGKPSLSDGSYLELQEPRPVKVSCQFMRFCVSQEVLDAERIASIKRFLGTISPGLTIMFWNQILMMLVEVGLFILFLW